MKKVLLLAVALASMMIGEASAIVVVGNPITGTNPNTSNPYTTGQITAANVSASGIGRGTGIVGNNGNNRYNANTWNVAGLDADKYFTFSITPDAGFEIDFTSFVYTGQASGTGPTSFAFRSSQDGFVSDIGSPSATGATIDLTPLSNVNSLVEFRFYAWGASSAAGTFSINDFQFDGTVSAVPEPSGLLMIGSVVSVALFRRRRS